MGQNIPQPQILEFTEINIGKFKTTKHFELVQYSTETPETDKINIVKDRQFAQSLPDYWLSYRLNNRWRRITGLFKVGDSIYYKGDKGQNNVKECLVIAQIDNDSRTVIIYTFKGYYSSDPAAAIELIQKSI
jgi:hypothetical protein